VTEQNEVVYGDLVSTLILVLNLLVLILKNWPRR